jgi:predicted nucleotidyltransferase
MEILTKAHKNILKELTEESIIFMLIGGYAVNYHGYARYTIDMDIWLKPDNLNKKKFINYLIKNRYSKDGIVHIEELNFEYSQSFHVGKNESRIDFLTRISGVEFSEAYSKSSKLKLDEIEIAVINYDNLIINKMISDRPQDKADVDELQRIAKYRKK